MMKIPTTIVRRIYFIIVIVTSILGADTLAAHVKVGDNPNSIQSASLMELESTNKGFVFPRVSLSSVTNSTPLATDLLQGTVVYNINISFPGGAGLFIWTGSAWLAVTPSSAISTDAWKLTGNTGTNPAINFLGTTDNQPLMFKVNGQNAGFISTTTNTAFGYNTLNINGSSFNSAFGNSALVGNTTGTGNSAFGNNALVNNVAGSYNTAAGSFALLSNTASFNTASGYSALRNNTSGNNNVANGYLALYSNTSGNFNIAAGSNALYFNTIGNNNLANGYYTLFSNTTGYSNTANGGYALFSNTSGNYNVANGDSALLNNTTGNNNSALGYKADVITGVLTNATAIGANAKVAISNALVLGDSVNNIKVGIGTGSPTANLHVKGSVRFANLINGLLSADAAGNLSTVSAAAAANAWSLTGNAGTDSTLNFLGNTDVKPIIFKINNQRSGYISSLGTNTSFGYQNLGANTAGTNNAAIGYNALKNNTTGNNNVASGYLALRANNTGNGNVANGVYALYSNVSGSRNVATGDSALFNNNSTNNIATGAFSLFSNTTGSNNVANGSNSLYGNTAGNQNAALGHSALNKSTTANNNTAAGAFALYNTLTGGLNAASGAYALFNNSTGTGNVAAGDSALYTNTTGSNNISIGYKADVTTNALTNATAIGYNAKVALSNALVLGDSVSSIKVGIGTGSPTANLHIKGSVRFASLTNGLLTADAVGNLSTVAASSFTNNWSLAGNAGTNPSLNFLGTTDNQPLIFKVNGQKSGLISSGTAVTAFGYSSLTNNTANNNTAFGSAAMGSNTTGVKNAAFGDSALSLNVDGLHNTAIGSFALTANSNGSFNTATGNYALYKNTSGQLNSAFGFYALELNTAGSYNTAVGNGALNGSTTGNYNTAIGDQAIIFNTTGSLNTAIGEQSLYTNTTGSFNTAIGEHADVIFNNLTNTTTIGANAKVAISNAMVLGDSVNNVKVGIGTGTPTANLHVKGSVRFATLTNGLLTADAAGNLSTVSASSFTNNWALAGNVGTDSTINFLGTTDAKPLIFKVNNLRSGYVGNSSANTSLGYQALIVATTGLYNTAIGAYSLQNNTASNNTALGSFSLYSNTTGSQNVANGDSALYRNTTGSGNTAMGHGSLYSNQTGSGNTATGYLALYFNTGNYNTANGVQALYNNTTGYNNTATGDGALLANTTGAHNTAFGNGALNANKINDGNTAVGDYALFNASGDANTAIGAGTLGTNTSGTNNTSVGYNSLLYNTTGSNNAGFGSNSVNGTTTGSYNIGIGSFALSTNTTGSNNTSIGANADVTLNNLTNATAIGSNTKVAVSNAVVLGNNANVGIGTSSPGINAKLEIVGSVSATVSNYHYFNNSTDGLTTGNGASQPYSLYTSSSIWCAGEIDVTSDERTKMNIATAAPDNDLSLVNKLRVVHYNYKDAVAKGNSTITGFLAQEVEKIILDAVNVNKGVVPDIYQNAVAIHYDNATKTLALTLKENTKVQAGDTLKLVTDAGDQLVRVASATGNNITINNWRQNSAWVFVYGRQVNDMRNLDYNKIFSTGIGAIQELSKQNDELKEDVEILKAQVKLLMAKSIQTASK